MATGTKAKALKRSDVLEIQSTLAMPVARKYFYIFLLLLMHYVTSICVFMALYVINSNTKITVVHHVLINGAKTTDSS